MLFGAKRHAASASLTAIILLVLAAPLYLSSASSIEIGLGITGLGHAAAGFIFILLSDGLLHATFTILAPRRYPIAFSSLIHYFSGQSSAAIAAGGLLAATEEVLFRGGLIPALVQLVDMNPHTAVASAALIFGALHFIPERPLAPFALWACWEGFLLGEVYLWSGSLIAVAAVHAIHDIGGFAAFRWLRSR